MSAHRIVVVESEKSPKVCSSNWKEDVILKRNLQVLDRSQRTVVNRIVVDQKILNRRFQTKLDRSKMSYARATGNVELQKKLRDQTTFVLNTNVGHNDDDDETLQRIWARGRRFYKRRLDLDIFRKKKEIGAFTCIEDDAPTELRVKKNPNIPDRPMTAVYVRPDTAVILDKTVLERRPFTSVDQRTKHCVSDTCPSAPVVILQRSQFPEAPDADKEPAKTPGSDPVASAPDRTAAEGARNKRGEENGDAKSAAASGSAIRTGDKEINKVCDRKQAADKNDNHGRTSTSEQQVSVPLIKVEDAERHDRASNPGQPQTQQNTRMGQTRRPDQSENGLPTGQNDLTSIAMIQLANRREQTTSGDRQKSLTGKSSKEVNVSSDVKSKPQSAANARGTNGAGEARTRRSRVRRRPSTAGGFLRTINDMLGPQKAPTPRAMSAKPNATRAVAATAGIGSMFGESEFQISLLDFQRFVVYSANYEARVKRYAERIQALQTDRARETDYYTAQLHSEAARCKRTMKMEAAAEATEEDIRRATGNLNVKSLTLKAVDPDLPLSSAPYRSSPRL